MRHQAIHRKNPARPLKWLIKNNLITAGTILHFGRGKDTIGTQALSQFGEITEYDPNIPEISDRKPLLKQYDAVISCFVLNCLRPTEREQAISEIAQAANGSAFIAVRSIKDTDIKVKQCKWAICEDGFTNHNIIKKTLKTSTGYGALFQKFYEPADLISELKKYFKTVFILHDKNHSIIAQASHIVLPKPSVKYAIGKQMIGCVYVHKSSEQILPDINIFKNHLPAGYDYAIVKFNWLKNTFSFIQSPDFNSAHEPTVGNSLIVHADGKTKLVRAPQDPWIYHHKWLMVNSAYKGFNVPQSMSRSLKWIRLNPDRAKIGKKSYWTKTVLPII